LEKIWDLADVDSDGNLDFEEFCIAMRLIFDMINGNISQIPDSLPDWLIPASKAHLVTANNAVKYGGGSNQSSISYNDDDDDELGLSTDFDWYISPEDRQTYSAVYTANADYRGLISFDSLTELYSTLGNVPETDITSAWNLVKPRSDEKIDKDQCLVFLHILNNRSKGVRVPRTVPASLRATFEKSKPEYNLNSKQSILNRPTPPTAPAGSASSKKSAFAEGYLSRLGVGGRSDYKTSGTDFSSTKGTDWEEVRLKRQLADLEAQIDKAETAADRRKKGLEDFGSSTSALVRRELEQLLDYKETQLRKLRNGELSTGAKNNLSGFNEEVDLITQQVQSLKDHQMKKKKDLDELKQEVASLA
jgi:hypothetical protein